MSKSEHSQQKGSGTSAFGPAGRRWTWVAVGLILVVLVGGAGWVAQRFYERAQARAEARAREQAAAERAQAETHLAELRKRFNEAAADPERQVRAIARSTADLVQRFPDLTGARTLLCLIRTDQGRAEDALHHGRISLEQDPDQPELHLHVGTLAQDLGKPDVAERHYQAAVELDPDHARARRHLGHMLAERGELDEARRHLEQAVELAPDLAAAHASLASLLRQRGQHEAALERVSRAIDLTEVQTFEGDDPERAKRLLEGYRLAQVGLLQDLGRHEQALLALRQLSGAALMRPESLRRMAVSLHALGRTDEAAMLFENALAMEPTNPEYAAGAVRWLIQAERWQAARSKLERLRRINPHDPAIETLQARLAAEQPATTQPGS